MWQLAIGCAGLHHPDAFSLPYLALSGMTGESQRMGRLLRAKERKREKTRENLINEWERL
jgi:hypothetical protein